MDNELDLRLLDLFRIQAGVLTRRQALVAGATARQIDYRVQRGHWLPIRRGIYRHYLFEVSPRMGVFALTLGHNGYASHRYAARLHGLEPALDAPPEVTVARGTHLHVPGLRLHESTQTRTAEVHDIDGLPVSGVERTIMDVAAVEPRIWWVLALIDSAKRKGLTDNARLGACLDRHARRGRDGTVRFREALRRLGDETKPAIGHLSRLVAHLATAIGLPHPMFEEPIFDGAEFVAQTDLSFEVPLLAFLDGYGPHSSRRQVNRDRWQRQRLRELGFVVVEYTYDQAHRSPAYVSRSLQRSYRQAEAAVRSDPRRWASWVQRRRRGVAS